MLPIAFAIALTLQALLVWLFAKQVNHRRIEHQNWSNQKSERLPDSEVILCLRGADQNLKAVLNALAKQDYLGKWRLTIVVDSKSDPSWPVVEQFICSNPKNKYPKPSWSDVEITSLDTYPTKGSLKCASLLLAINNLHPDSSFIALVDADAAIGTKWLTNLIQACSQPGVGAVSGNRWYIPARNSLIGWTRAVWNAGALVLMTLLAIPWGGSLAIRREVIETSSWRALLKHGLCEDTGLLQPLKELGMRYVFRPELLAINHDDEITFSQLIKWITRQLITARLHHPRWSIVLLHGLGTSALLLIGLINNAWGALAAYEFGCLGLLVWIETIAMQKRPHSLKGWISALITGQFINGLATLLAIFAKKVEWKQITYRITQHPQGVEFLNSITSIAVAPPSTGEDSPR